jgi:hypothetical protein
MRFVAMDAVAEKEFMDQLSFCIIGLSEGSLKAIRLMIDKEIKERGKEESRYWECAADATLDARSVAEEEE